MTRVNEWGQPIGEPLGEWHPPSKPRSDPMDGRYIKLLPLRREHAAGIFEAFRDAPRELWTYMGFEVFQSTEHLEQLVDEILGSKSWVPFAAEVEGRLQGFASYLRVDPPSGVLEVGSIFWSPALQKTVASTEAIALMLDHAFGLGYRRVEWKCDALNDPSRRAADRLGFGYEGTFRKATHYKGRNRDTAWYSMTDEEWPARKAAFDTWLDPSNFDGQGSQMRSLSEIRSGERN